MPITKLALQRRHLVELDIIKQYVGKYSKLWTTMREQVKIIEVIPFADPKLWNCFSVRCNYVDDFIISTLEGEGYKVAEIKWLGYDPRGSSFDIKVLKIEETGNIGRLKACLNSAAETKRIEELCNK